jgi:hypothetical protein
MNIEDTMTNNENLLKRDKIDSINRALEKAPHNFTNFKCVDIRIPRPGDYVIEALFVPEIERFLREPTYWSKPSGFTPHHRGEERPVFKPLMGCCADVKPVATPAKTIDTPKVIYFDPTTGNVYIDISELPLSEKNKKEFILFTPEKKQSIKLIRKVCDTTKL